MSLGFCIPRDVHKQLKSEIIQSAQMDDGILKWNKSQVETFFKQMLDDPNVAKKAADSFLENVKDSKSIALKKWMDENLKKEGKTSSNILDDVEMLGIHMDDDFFEALARAKNGVLLTGEQLKTARVLAKKVAEKRQALVFDGKDHFADIRTKELTDKNIEFLNARNELSQYAVNMKDLDYKTHISTVFRSNILGTFQTLLMQVFGGTWYHATMTGVARQIRKHTLSKQFSSALVNSSDIPLVQRNGKVDDIAKVVDKALYGDGQNFGRGSFILNQMRVLAETGVDFSRIIGTGDVSEAVLGDVVQMVKNTSTNTVGNFYLKNIDKLNKGVRRVVTGVVDSGVATHAFFGSVKEVTAGLAQHLGWSEGDIQKFVDDAMTASPQTNEGWMIRKSAVLDANISAFTQDGGFVKATQALIRMLDKTPGVPLGTLMVPVNRIPTNVIIAGLRKYSLVDASFYTLSVLKTKFINKQPVSYDELRGIIDGLVYGAAGWGGAIAAYELLFDDFVGAYDTNRYKYDELMTGNFSAFRVKDNIPLIGGKWVNTDLLGPAAVVTEAYGYVKKYGQDTPQSKISTTLITFGMKAFQTPVLEKSSDIFNKQKKLKETEGQKSTEAIGSALSSEIGRTAVSAVPFLGLRMLNQFSQAARDLRDQGVMDVRQQEKIYEETYPKIAATFMASMGSNWDFVSGSIPSQYDSIGRLVKEEGPWSSIFFGQRLSNRRDTDDISKEIIRLNDTGNKPTMTSLKYAYTDKRLTELRAKIGEKRYNELARKFGERLFLSYSAAMKMPEYTKADDSKKSALLDRFDGDLKESIFAQPKDWGITEDDITKKDEPTKGEAAQKRVEDKRIKAERTATLNQILK